MSFCWRDIIGRKQNSEQVGLGHLTPMYHYSRTFPVGAQRINLMGSLVTYCQFNTYYWIYRNIIQCGSESINPVKVLFGNG